MSRKGTVGGVPLCIAVTLLTGCRVPATDMNAAPRLQEPLAHLAFLTGAWVRDDGDLRSEEHWTEPRGGTMFGIARTIAGKRTVFFEYLRVEARPEGAYYLASPQGRSPPTAFRQVKQSEGRVVFENPEHDYPQRVIYWRTSDGGLAARIEGQKAGHAQAAEWHWTRLENHRADP